MWYLILWPLCTMAVETQLRHHQTKLLTEPGPKVEHTSVAYNVVYHTESGDIPGLSTTLQCIINLVLQYFIIFTVSSIVRALFIREERKLLFSVVDAAITTVSYSAMLCILFLAARLRALQITDGAGDPQLYVRVAMQVASWAVLFNTCVVVIYPIVTGREVEVDHDGNIDTAGVAHTKGGLLLRLCRYLGMTGLYGGFLTVCIGICLMNPTSLNSQVKTEIPVSPAVHCTISLGIQYFLVYLILMIGRGFKNDRAIAAFTVGAFTVNMVPMLCILFICARMRALSAFVEPQYWAQNSMIVCTYSMLMLTIITILPPLFQTSESDRGRDRDFSSSLHKLPSQNMANFFQVVRFICLLLVYVSLTIVIVSMIVITDEYGMKTPPMSTTVFCCLVMCMQYFFTMVGSFIIDSLHSLEPSQQSAQSSFNQQGRSGSSAHVAKSALTAWVTLFENLAKTVQFSCMLCVLFMGTRMRALQITDQLGQPQGWAQEAMYFSTFSLVLQMITLILMSFCGGKSVTIDNDGNAKMVDDDELKADDILVDTKLRQPTSSLIPRREKSIVQQLVGTALSIQKWACLLGIYAGSIVIVISVFEITPETATGCGGILMNCPSYHPLGAKVEAAGL